MFLVYGLLCDFSGIGIYILKYNWVGRRLRVFCLYYFESIVFVVINNKNGFLFYIYNYFNKIYFFGFYYIFVVGMK